MDKKRILIIEDDTEINRLLKTILEKNEYLATAAFSGTEGLLQIQMQSFDLVLLDLMLPGLSGEELIEKIRGNSLIPIIVLSAKKDLEDKVHVLKSGADDYITKPFNEEEVLVRIEVQLRRNPQTIASSLINWRKIQIDVDKRFATVNEKELTLTNAEFDILKLGMATLFLTKIIRCCECCGVMAPIALDNEHPRI
ncbi:response regulator transcription factor [Enterococcus avium]